MIQFFLLPDRSGKETDEGVLVGLYCKIQRAVNALIQENKRHVTIVIDDIPLLEVAANGSINHVLDFLHYCHTLTSEIVRPFKLTDSYFLHMFLSYSISSIHTLLLPQGCSIIALNHEDVYVDIERPLILQMEHLADVLIKVGPLATGIAKDVHGQVPFIVFITSMFINIILYTYLRLIYFPLHLPWLRIVQQLELPLFS